MLESYESYYGLGMGLRVRDEIQDVKDAGDSVCLTGFSGPNTKMGPHTTNNIAK